MWLICCFFFQAEDGIRDAQESRGLGDVYKRQVNGNTILGGATQISALGGGGNLLVMTDNAGNLYSTSTSAVIPEAMPIGTSGQTIRHDGGA